MITTKHKLLAQILFLCAFWQGIAQEWQTDIETAKKIAEDGDRSIILVFQGSDWCAPCIKLDKEIWSTAEFKSLAKTKFVMLKADFPRRKKNKLSPETEAHNKTLAQKYNPKGHFPYVVILDNHGKILGDMGYEKISPTAYFNKLNAFSK
ncbi:thioredoxin family protein [Flagellimonas sp. 2504JD4-2]